MVKICFLDLDGVLVSFYNAALSVMGMTRDLADLVVPPGEWHFSKYFCKDDNEFWKKIDQTPRFWQSLDKMDDADHIVETCEQLFGSNVYLLTSPPLNPSAFSGKAEWVQKHYPHLYRKLFIGAAKEAFAHSGAVLVDDSDSNIEKFKKAGGKAVLVPRRWNSGHQEADKTATLVRLGLMGII